jgi:fluoroacetyl-CoA thioesterase
MNMDFALKLGIKGRKEIIVQLKDTAKAYGSGLVEVFATPAMVALMEVAASDSIQVLLPSGFVTVGTEVNIKHIKATALYKKVWAVSDLLTVEGKKLIFSIEAYDELGKIGFGRHTRYIVDEKKFMSEL